MKNNTHWTEHELIELHYGVRSSDPHLKDCAECRSRLEVIEKRRQWAVSCLPEPPVSFEAPRARTLERIRREAGRQPWHRRWQITAPLAATAALAAFFFLVPREQPTTLIAHSDQQLFQEIQEMVVTAEPDAASSIHFLFAGAPLSESQVAVESQ